MKNDQKQKLIYWLVSLFTIIFIFLIVFGVVGPWVIESNVDHVKIFASVVFVLGLIIIMLSLYWPKFLFGVLVKKEDSKIDGKYDVVGAIILGLSFVIGAFLYVYFRNVDVIIGSFGLAVILMRLRI